MRKLISLVILACAGVVRAQSPEPLQFPPADPLLKSRMEMEMLRRTVDEGNALLVKQATAAREEQIARTEFCSKANHFVMLWMDFANRLNDKKTFDAKLAKKLAKAFHELEASDGWPVREAAK